MTDFDDFDTDPDFVRVADPEPDLDLFERLADILACNIGNLSNQSVGEEEIGWYIEGQLDRLDKLHPGFKSYFNTSG